MNKAITRTRLALGAAALFCLVVVPIAAAGAAGGSGDPKATASASVKKQVKELMTQVGQLELQPGPQGPPGEKGEKGDPGEPGLSTGPAGGDLTGNYPDPSIAGGAVNSAKVEDNSLTGTDVNESSLGLVPNADAVDGFNANSLVRAAGASSDNLPDSDGDALTASITAPGAGFLHIVGSVDLVNPTTGDTVQCRVQVDDVAATGSLRGVDLDGDLTTLVADGHSHTIADVNTDEDCATNAVVAVGAGVHAVDFNISSVGAGTSVVGGALNVLFVPFDGTGS